MTDIEAYERWVKTTDAYRQGRSDALEEAAKWLEECEGQEIADAIRALKEKS